MNVNPPRDKPVASMRDLLSWRVADIVTLHGNKPVHPEGSFKLPCSGYRDPPRDKPVASGRCYLLLW